MKATESVPRPARLLTVRETAGLLNCSLKTVRRRIDDGSLPAVRDRGLMRIHPDDLERYIRSRRW